MTRRGAVVARAAAVAIAADAPASPADAVRDKLIVGFESRKALTRAGTSSPPPEGASACAWTTSAPPRCGWFREHDRRAAEEAAAVRPAAPV